MGMMRNNIQMTTTVRKDNLLKTLRANLEKHSGIVQEARDGYVKKAKIALEKRLEQIRKGVIVGLTFQLTPPADYTEIYKSTIKMLEWNTEDEIELAADEFRQLVEDKWDWQDSFLTSNMGYSKRAFDWLNETTGGTLVAPAE